MKNRPAKLLHYDEWQGSSGFWYCNDTSDLCSVRALWWVPAHMLNISPAEYVKWLVENFKPDHISYNEERDVLIYSWDKQSDCRRFKNWLNAEARRCQYIV